MARPKGPLSATLAAHNVTMTEAWGAYRLTCAQCGATWDIQPPAAGGRLPAGYWQCPQGCNAVDQAPDKPAEEDFSPQSLAQFLRQKYGATVSRTILDEGVITLANRQIRVAVYAPETPNGEITCEAMWN